MAGRISAGPATAFDVHVTGRRVLAIIADGLVLGVAFSAMLVLARMAGVMAAATTRSTRAYRQFLRSMASWTRAWQRSFPGFPACPFTFTHATSCDLATSDSSRTGRRS